MGEGTKTFFILLVYSHILQLQNLSLLVSYVNYISSLEFGHHLSMLHFCKTLWIRLLHLQICCTFHFTCNIQINEYRRESSIAKCQRILLLSLEKSHFQRSGWLIYGKKKKGLFYKCFRLTVLLYVYSGIILVEVLESSLGL